MSVFSDSTSIGSASRSLLSSEVSSRLRRAPIGMNITDEEVEQFRKDYGIEPIRQTNTPPKPHPHLAYQRNTLERKAFKLASGLGDGEVLDVGSSPRRALRFTKVHCLVPQLQPGDPGRLRRYVQHPRVCTHTLQEYLVNSLHGTCQNCVPVDAAVFVHSAYYFEPCEFVQLLKSTAKNTLYVVGHVFHDASGNMKYGEGHYHMEGDMVHFKAYGNHHHYVHKVLPWNSSATFTSGNDVVDVELLETMGSTHLWLLSLAAYRPPEVETIEDREWDTLILDNKHVGNIHIPPSVLNTQQSLIRTTQINFPLDTLYGDGPLLYTTGAENIRLTIPRGLIQHVASNLVYRTRDPALIANAVFYARNYVRNAPIPRETEAKVIAVAVVLGMCVNVASETRLLQHMTTHYGTAFKRHAQLLQMFPLKVVSIWVIALIGLATLLAFVILDHFVHTPFHALLLAGVSLIVLSIMLMLLLHKYQTHLMNVATREWMDQLNVQRRSTNVHVPTAAPSLIHLVGSTAFRPPGEQDPEARVVVTPDPKPPKNPGKSNTRLIGSGIIPDIQSVSVFESNQEAEHSAVTTRITRKLQPVHGDALAKYELVWSEHPQFVRLGEIRVKDNEQTFLKWLERYPEKEREKYREAYRSIQENGVNEKDAYCSAFIKLEKKANIDRSGETDGKPRIIQNPSDRYKVATGPFTWSLSNHVAKLWNGKSGPIVYVRGLKAEDISDLVYEYCQRYGGYYCIVMIDDDFVVYDSSVRPQHKKPFRRLFPEIGASPTTVTAYSFEVTKGKTRHGVKYSMPRQQINSGSNDTNLMGTVVNAAAHTSCSSVLECKEAWLMLLNGDDNGLLVPQLVDSGSVKLPVDPVEMQDHLRRLGFEPTMNVRYNPWEWEFCSKIFLPIDKGDTEYLLITPKPGRIILRIGFNLTNSGAANLKGAVLSLLQDCAHVPFLAPYLRRVLELIPRSTKARYEKHSDEWMFHTRQAYKATSRTYEYMFKRYGLTQEDENLWIADLAKVVKLPTIMPSERIQRMLEIDNQ